MSKDRYSDDHTIELVNSSNTLSFDSNYITINSESGSLDPLPSYDSGGHRGGNITAGASFEGSVAFNDSVGISGGSDSDKWFYCDANAALRGPNINIGANTFPSQSKITISPKDTSELLVDGDAKIDGKLTVTGGISGAIDLGEVEYEDFNIEADSISFYASSANGDVSLYATDVMYITGANITWIWGGSTLLAMGDSVADDMVTNTTNVGCYVYPNVDQHVNLHVWGDGMLAVSGGDVDASGNNHVCCMSSEGNGSDADVLKLQIETSANPGANNKFIRFNYNVSADTDLNNRDAGTECGSISGDGSGGILVNGIAFTGRHPSVMKKNPLIKVGMIVDSTGEIWAQNNNNVSTAIPKVCCSEQNNSNVVYGVIAEINTELYEGYYESYGKLQNEDLVAINSLGEGRVWVTNCNGEVSNGDYITSSEVMGYGMKQDDDILHSYTAAKCVEDIDWASVVDIVEHDGVEHKRYLSACTYHCG